MPGIFLTHFIFAIMKHTTTRTRNYRAFRKQVKELTKKYIYAYTNPFGSNVVTGFAKFELKFAKLPVKWQEHISRRANAAIDLYHTATIEMPNGEYYSPAEMDALMVRM
jgi:hypothetical protein